MKRGILLLFLAWFCLCGLFNPVSETNTACTALTGSYVAKNTLTPRMRVLTIQNTCNATIKLSVDGTTDGLTLMPGVGGTFDWKDVHGNEGDASRTLYVKHGGAAPTAGTLIITVIE